MRSLCWLILCAVWVLSVSLNAQDYSLQQIRSDFYLSTLDYKFAFPLIENLNEIHNPNALILAYRGATEAMLAKPGWNIFKKIGYLKQSRDSFEEAVKRDKDDIEIRFLRLSVEYHIPRYLGLSENLQEDKKVIIQNAHLFREKQLPVEITDYIILFCKQSGLYSKAEICNLVQLLDHGE